MITRCSGCGKVLIASGYAVAPFDPRTGGFWLPPLEHGPAGGKGVRDSLCPGCRDDSDPGPAAEYGEDPDPLGGASVVKGGE